MDMHALRKPIMDYFRARRLRRFCRRFPSVTSPISILDVGGGDYPWDRLDSPATVTLLNTRREYITARSKTNRYAFVEGDGRALPFDDRSFDLVFSNSVIEHVGGFDDQAAFAREMSRVADALYCQTPNRWFIVEPHAIALLVHWLPRRLQRRLLRWCSVWGWVARPSQAEVDQFLATTRLLTYDELIRLYPDCEIERETFLGLTKSFLVLRTSPSAPISSRSAAVTDRSSRSSVRSG